MADIEHKDLPDSELHEPKRLASAGASDAGKVLTPSASPGVSELRKLDATEITNLPVGAPEYAVAGVVNTSTVISIAAASDSNLDTDADYVNITSPFSQELSNVMDFGSTNSNQFTVDTDGDYRIVLTINANVINTAVSGAINLAFKARRNTTFSGRKFEIEVDDTSRPVTISISDYDNLTAGDTIDFWAAAEDATDLTIHDASAMLELIRDTS